MNHSLLACSLLACSDGQAGNYMWLEPGTLAQVLCLPVCAKALLYSRARAAWCQHQLSSLSSTCLIMVIIIIMSTIIIIIIIIIISSSSNYSSSNSYSGLWSAAAGASRRRRSSACCSACGRAWRCSAAPGASIRAASCSPARSCRVSSLHFAACCSAPCGSPRRPEHLEVVQLGLRERTMGSKMVRVPQAGVRQQPPTAPAPRRRLSPASPPRCFW